MALSFEESKKLLMQQQAATSMMMSLPTDNIGIMTLAANDTGIAAYSDWTKDNKYDWYDEYTDDVLSNIDKNKNITVDPSQINITQEENSQFIPFEMSRYYDGFDLTKAEIWIWYKTSDGYVGSDRAVNVSYDTATIKFGWLIDGKATHIAGQLKFEIRAIGANSKGKPYVWKTKTYDKLNVLQSLINDKSIKLDDSWVQVLVEKIAENVAEQIAEAQIDEQVAVAENAASRAETAANRAQTVVNDTLVNYYTKQEVDAEILNIDREISNINNDFNSKISVVSSDLNTKISAINTNLETNYYTNAEIYNKSETENYVREQIDAIPDVDLSGYALKSDIPTDYLKEIPSEYITEEELDAKKYLTEHQSLEGFATETYVDEAVKAVDVSEQLKDYALKSEVPSIDGLATKTYVDAAIEGVDVKDQLVDYALKRELPVVPENVSEFENDVGYLTEQNLVDYALKSEIPSIEGLATEKYVNEAVKAVDVSDQLGDLSDKDGNLRTVKQYVDDSVAAVDVSEQLKDYAKSEDVYTKSEVDEVISNVEVDLSGYYTKVEIDEKEDALESSISTNTTSIAALNKNVEEINQTLAGVDKSPRVTYEATYGDVEMDDGTTAEYMFTLWETEGSNQPTVKSRFQIMGGGGGGAGSVILRIAYVEGYTTPLVSTINDPVIVKFEFTGEDSAGDTNLDGIASWKVGNRVVATQDVATGVCEFDLTNYVSVGDNKVLLTITHATGAVATKAWTVKVVDVRLESDFDDTKKNTANAPVNFTFTPYGGVEKTVHFLLDGKEIATKISSAAASGLSDSYAIPAQPHGTHLFEAYMTANINNKTIESNHIVKDIIWYDETSDVPVISCVKQEFTARQYEATNIAYTVYDPSTETPNVTLRATYVNENGDVVEEFSSNLVLNSNTPDPWQYKTDVIGEHTLTITCGQTVKTLKVTVVELGIDVSPITAGLVFDFNPVGYSNNDKNRLWSSGNIAMSVSDNFDWVNGGYQIDDNGDQCFCIKAGTSADINYELFGDDAKENGKQMKLIFKTENVADSEATFMSCVSASTAGDKIGIIMKAHEATIYANADKDKLPLPYAEEEIIEFEFNITPSSSSPSMIMGYEDGVSTRPFVYNSTHNFQQQLGDRKTITLGSPDCDLYIYRFKIYENSLSDRDILNNFIADARSAEEMIDRYNRNQIYKEGILDPDYLAEVCPQLRIIKIETPYFTSDKDEKIGRIVSEKTGETLMTNVECIYKGGDPILDNWVATDVVHSGQGTSSNNYGPSGRNLDIIMKRYKDKKTQKYLNESPIITLSDNTQVSKVSLTRNSVDVNYFNIKVNIASSENANNALLAKRFNSYQPYKRPIVRPADTLEDHYTEEEISKMSEDQKAKIIAGYQEEAQKKASYVKDTMEFQNCVIFVKESDPNLATHREFNDNNWHFYGIGNIGDSKKTDDTRLTDPDDPYECILEVMDNELPNSTMPTGVVDANGAPVYPISPAQWVAGNPAYDALAGELFDESKSDDKENGLADTYGWRYIYEDGTDEQNAEYKAYVENKWREFYTFVVTSTDEEFKAHLGDYCVLNSVMYYYLFTLRYTMTDNYAKNSFWHYGKTGEVDADGNPIRKWDLNFDYDNDFLGQVVVKPFLIYGENPEMDNAKENY